MKEIFVDTNIFIRHFLKDDKKLSPLAQEIISACQQGRHSLVVCPAILLETSWLLSSFYKLSKKRVIELLNLILDLENAKIIDRQIIEETLTVYSQKNIDHIDAFVAATMNRMKISEIFSFDRDFDKIPHLRRLTSPLPPS